MVSQALWHRREAGTKLQQAGSQLRQHTVKLLSTEGLMMYVQYNRVILITLIPKWCCSRPTVEQISASDAL